MSVQELTAPTGQRGSPDAWRGLGLVLCLVVLAVLVVVSLTVGAKIISLSTAWDALFHYAETDDQVIVSHFRVPRTALAVLVGAALGVSGALMQALTRNPLADPGILGINAGASLAVVVAVAFLDVESLAGYVWFGLAGAGVATVLVYALGSGGRGSADPVRIALAGAATSAVLGGFVSAIVLVDLNAFDGYRAWSVGTPAGRDSSVFWQVLPFLAVGLVVALAMPRVLNTLALGDEMARALGAKVGRARMLGAIATTLLCGAATAAIGPIAFVGLVVPHGVRSVVGPDNRWLLPYSAVCGGILLVTADVVGRIVARPGELEAAVVTAAIGAPVFVALVRRRRLAAL